MGKKLKVLHIASFIGNLGDNANHIGAKYLRDNFLDYEFDITKKEIRSFYWEEWLFNSEEFVKEANTYDLVMIGGGNYFELWVEDSKTGTSVDLSLEYLKKIDTPILFYALGCDTGQGVPKENVEKFKSFMDYLTSSDKYFITVRNDGAIENIEGIYGNRYKDKIVEIADGGFFTKVNNLDHFELEEGKKNIVINIAGDMPEVRFPGTNGSISYETFISELSGLIGDLNQRYEDNINVIFAPHIFRDLKTIYDVIDQVQDKIRRNNIKVAPYLIGDKAHDYIFSLYNQADLILGMRFHSNVCAYALERNVIGLVNYVQVLNLYKNIDSKEFIEVNKIGFKKELENKIIEHIEKEETYIEQSKHIKSEQLRKTKNVYEAINEWLNLNFGGNNNGR